MLKYVKDYSTFRFFEFYCMLYMRKHLQQEGSNKIMLIGYYPIFNVLNYIKFETVYDLLIEKYCGNYCDDSEAIMYEDVIEISCEATVGIEVNYINDPVNCLQLAKEKGLMDDFIEYLDVYVWGQCIVEGFAKNGHILCLKFIFENFNRKYDINVGEYIHPLACDEAAINGQLECLKFLCENYVYYKKETLCCAAEYGKLECLKYLFENQQFFKDDGNIWDPVWGGGACDFAAHNRHLDCLKYAYENGCTINKYTMRDAAIGGRISCIRYLREKGCKWNTEACAMAAHQGKIKSLKYLHVNGCPWDRKKPCTAFSAGNKNCC